MYRYVLLTASVISASSSILTADDSVITDPAKAGKDFQIQGEYSGDLGSGDDKETFGIHIIAQGKGKFRVVGYHGGLPGDGWNGEDPVRVEGEFALSEDGSLTVKDKHGSGIIKNGVLVCDLGDDGQVDGKLKRVVRKSPTIGKKPPEGAIVLYGGADDVTNWKGGKADENGHLKQGVTSIENFGSINCTSNFVYPSCRKLAVRDEGIVDAMYRAGMKSRCLIPSG